MPPKPPAGKKGDRRKLLIYGAIGGGLLLVFMLLRGRSAAAAATPATTTATPSTASDGLGAGSSGIDNSAQLASFENALLNQLPQAITSGIQAGQANAVPAAASGDATSQLTNLIGALSPLFATRNDTPAPAPSSSLSDLTGVISAIGPLLVGTGAGGQQVGSPQNIGGQAGSSSAGNQTVQAVPHPVAVAAAMNHQAGNPRDGLSYTPGTYKGHRAHVYAQKVPKGVGPGGNIIVL